MFAPVDDFPHPVPPQAFMTWKENWVFPALDRDQRVALLFHFSLRPAQGEGILSAKFTVQGHEFRYVGRNPVPKDLSTFHPVTDGRLTLTVLEPAKRQRVTYTGPDIDVDVVFTGRFAKPFDYADGVRTPSASVLGEIGETVFPFHHFEQGMEFEGTVTVKEGELAGQTLHVSGWGNRDHSWGFRDDFQFRYHHWVCASFSDRYVQGTVMRETSYPAPKPGGFVASEAGNVAVLDVDTSEAYWLTPNEPLPALDKDVRYVVRTVDGQTHTVTAHISEPYGALHLNARAPERDQAYQDVQIFCDYTLEETGERGTGVLELGKHLHGPGIADTV